MGENSKIAWTDHTFNPWWGCAKVSDGCKNCYAESFDKRLAGNTYVTHWGIDAPRRFFGEKHWNKPLLWNEKAEKEEQRMRVFCASMADVFEINHNPEINRQMNNARSKLFFDIIPNTPCLDWLILTKRPENIFSLGTDAAGCIFDLYLADYPNVWLGATMAKQQDEWVIGQLAQTPAKVMFLSLEPMLEPIDLIAKDYQSSAIYPYKNDKKIDWVIVGGESGSGCRPFEWDWARSIRDQCADAGVPFFMKQGGGHPNKREKLEDIPEDLRVREFPKRVTY